MNIVQENQLSFISGKNREESRYKLLCPFCKSTHSKKIKYDERHNDFLSAFPTNKELLRMIEEDNAKKNVDMEACNKHGIFPNLVCFDVKCANNRLICWKCLKGNHMSCSAESLIDRYVLQSEAEIVYYNLTFNQFLDSVELAKGMVINNIVKQISDKVDKFTEQVKKQFFPKIDLKAWKIDGSDFKNWTLSTQISPDSTQIKLSPKNKKQIDYLSNFETLQSIFTNSVTLNINLDNFYNSYKLIDPAQSIFIQPAKSIPVQPAKSTPVQPAQSICNECGGKDCNRSHSRGCRIF